jgi:alanine racemase
LSSSLDDPLVLRPHDARAEDCLRPTRAEIDLAAIAQNLEALKAAVPHGRVLCVVKADGYGHGVIPVVRRLAAEGAFAFGVALAEEGLELREAGVAQPILVLNGVIGGAHRELVERRLRPVVYEAAEARAFAAAARERPVPIHLKIDTGMSRLGVPDGKLDAFLDLIESLPELTIEGVMTHLAAADTDDEYTTHQLDRFDRALERIRARGHRPRVVHAANSAGTLRHPRAHYDMVRPGLALFGYPGAPGVSVSLRPAMRLRTEIVSLRTLAPGERVGYDGTFRAARVTRVATLPVGYGDGYLRALSNHGEVLLHGQRCPVIGNVSMDLMGVDVTDVPGAALGDEVVLLGAQGGEVLSAEALAEAAGTIPYEILTNVSRRVPRFYGEGPASDALSPSGPA